MQVVGLGGYLGVGAHGFCVCEGPCFIGDVMGFVGFIWFIFVGWGIVGCLWVHVTES